MYQNSFGEYLVHISAPGPRPKMLDFVEFLWGYVPFDLDIDTDPHSTQWKELTIANRLQCGRVDVDIVKENPLILKVCSKDTALLLRAATYLAEHCGGEVFNEP